MTAHSFEDFARDVLNMESPSQAMLNWALVSVFYAAVHYINTYLWEFSRAAPTSHIQRERTMTMWPPLHPTIAVYDKLRNSSHNARYTPGFKAKPNISRTALDTRLVLIRGLVLAALADDDT